MQITNLNGGSKMNEQKQVLLKKTKSFTFILAIYCTVSSLLSIVGIFSLTAVDSLRDTVPELADLEITTFDFYSAYIGALLFIVLSVFFFVNNKKLKDGQVVTKIPYFLFALNQLYGIVSSLVVVNLISTGILIFGLIYNVAIGSLAIIPMIYLSKLGEESKT